MKISACADPNLAQVRRGVLEYARLAQLVEHLTLNQGVRGSNPRSRTSNSLDYCLSNKTHMTRLSSREDLKLT